MLQIVTFLSASRILIKIVTNYTSQVGAGSLFENINMINTIEGQIDGLSVMPYGRWWSQMNPVKAAQLQSRRSTDAGEESSVKNLISYWLSRRNDFGIW